MTPTPTLPVALAQRAAERLERAHHQVWRCDHVSLVIASGCRTVRPVRNIHKFACILPAHEHVDDSHRSSQRIPLSHGVDCHPGCSNSEQSGTRRISRRAANRQACEVHDITASPPASMHASRHGCHRTAQAASPARLRGSSALNGRAVVTVQALFQLRVKRLCVMDLLIEVMQLGSAG
jgi:hypothetical protein